MSTLRSGFYPIPTARARSYYRKQVCYFSREFVTAWSSWRSAPPPAPRCRSWRSVGSGVAWSSRDGTFLLGAWVGIFLFILIRRIRYQSIMFVSSLIFILKLMFRNKSFNLLSLIFIFILKLRFRNKSFNFDTFKKKLPLLIYIIIGENLKVLKATH